MYVVKRTAPGGPGDSEHFYVATREGHFVAEVENGELAIDLAWLLNTVATHPLRGIVEDARLKEIPDYEG